MFFLWQSDINYPGENLRVFLVKWHKINLIFNGSLDLSRALFSSWGFSHAGWSPLKRRAVKQYCRTAHVYSLMRSSVIKLDISCRVESFHSWFWRKVGGRQQKERRRNPLIVRAGFKLTSLKGRILTLWSWKGCKRMVSLVFIQIFAGKCW